MKTNTVGAALVALAVLSLVIAVAGAVNEAWSVMWFGVWALVAVNVIALTCQVVARARNGTPRKGR